MRTFGLFSGFLICLVLIQACSKTSDPPQPSLCSEESEENNCEWYGNKTPSPWSDISFNNYTEGTSRVFQVSTPAEEDACIDSHIEYFLNCFMALDQPRKIQVRLKYRYGFFGVFGDSRITTMSEDQGLAKYAVKGDFGIKNAYVESPGSFYFAVEWIIENAGDVNADLDYFKSKFKAGVLNYYYKLPPQ